MAVSTTRVLVVGAGPTGLTLAAALRQRGIDCVIIDQRQARGTTSRALGIQARTMEVLARLGIAEAVMREGLPLTGQAFHLSSGVAVAGFHGVHPLYPAMTMLAQARTEAILESVAPQVMWGRRFVGMEGDRSARVSDVDGNEECIAADWIIGCDGANSVVRGVMGAAFPGKVYDAHLALADCRVDGLEAGIFHVFPDHPMIAFAIPGGLWRVVATIPDQGATGENDMGLFQRAGMTASAPVWQSTFHIHQRAASVIRKGNLLLAGDAAHVHSPAGGQGMNIGIQDAWWLAEALSGGDRAIDAWCKTRRAVARKVLRASDRMTRAMLWTPAPIIPIRDMVLRLSTRSAYLSRKLEADIAGLGYPPVSAAA